MRSILKTAMLAVAFFLALAPTGVWAYSYGDANKEDVAETFKLIVSSLNQSPADWNAAAEAHKARRAEIASHFGAAVAATLDKNIESRKADIVIANYKALLVMNLDRRFNNAIESIKDYTQAKLLLAKAKATFETLEPYAEAKLTKEQIAGINNDFNKALDDIGNPGLFGVGKKEADPEGLKTAVNRIYDEVKPLFPYQDGKANTDSSNTAAPGDTTANNGGEIDGTQKHAPMERAEKTNTSVTIGVIGGVIVIGAGAVWWARRRGFF
ncbi:hypothetical protein KZ483_03280 [Paenibacillus sp. sptzw28]|uniref:hypothetical protein n=1 Tax=Paenibacillus sp. sptzw28 TaxID=715179 RepID=UPI001C6E452F|nr:hypothetical protein [Paenibacillus sp. sptzw28]QYR22064.1 hypothetical protein KZ483_03280 [Paenibacillus sp. sptzw28]